MLINGTDQFDIFYITSNPVTICYKVQAEDSDQPEFLTVRKSANPHHDFLAAFAELVELCVPRFCELEMSKKELKESIRGSRIIFKQHGKLGLGCQIRFERSLKRCDSGLKLSTPFYYEGAPDDQNQLNAQEIDAINKLKTEAFLYAYRSKCGPFVPLEEDGDEDGQA